MFNFKKILLEPKYLILGVKGVLSGIRTQEVLEENDLLIDHTYQDYQVLKKGVDVMRVIDILMNQHEYKFVIISKSTEEDLVLFVNKFKQACQQKQVPFPKISAMIIDSNEFEGYSASEPEIKTIKSLGYDIHTAGCDREEEDEKEKSTIFTALSKLLSTSETSRHKYIIFDQDAAVIANIKGEGWQAYEISDGSSKVSLHEALLKVLEKETTQFVKFYMNNINIDRFSYEIPKHNFEPIKTTEKIAGSSLSRHWFKNTDTQTKWFGKCDKKAIGGKDLEEDKVIFVPPDKIVEYKEYLAIKLYSLFGVTTPEVTLSEQPLSDEAKKLYADDAELLLINEPRLHFMSAFVNGFNELGKNFVEDYKKHAEHESYQYLSKPLRGFGRALAVAEFLHDFDCIGNSGGNMGVIVSRNYVEVVKIDAGEALPFPEDLTKAEGVQNNPKSRVMLIGTDGSIIQFQQLTKADQWEFVFTLENILRCDDNSLTCIFKDVIEKDKRFKELLDHLIKRKNDFIFAFSGELKRTLTQQIEKLKTEKAEQIAAQWGRHIPPLTEDSRLILLQTQLDGIHYKAAVPVTAQ